MCCALRAKRFQKQLLAWRDPYDISEWLNKFLYLDMFQTALKSDDCSTHKLPLRGPFREQFRTAFECCHFPNVDCRVTRTPLGRMSLGARSNLESLVSWPTSGDYRIWDGIKTNEEGLKPSLTRKCEGCQPKVLSYSQFFIFTSKWISQ